MPLTMGASVPAKETRDGAGGLSGVPDYIPPSNAAGPPRKRLRSAPPADGGDAKRIKDVGNGGVPDTALLNDNGQFQLEPQSLLFSCRPSEVASDTMLGPSGSTEPRSSFKLDGAKHKIFLSHSGAQKDFVEQLCKDLEDKGYVFPFFDQRHHSLPPGENFAPLIIEAARLCHVAVVVLSEEFLCSKWPMIELATFYNAQQGARDGSGKLKLLPLFFKLSVEEVKDEGRWMPRWKDHATSDNRIELSKWSAAVKALCKSNGLDFGKFGRKEVAYREGIVASIFNLSPPNLGFRSFEKMVGFDRMCKAMSTKFVKYTTIGVYGMAGLGKTMLAKALHDYFFVEFLGKVCYVDMRKESRAHRHKKILKMLFGFEKGMVDNIADGLEEELMKIDPSKKRNKVFLVLDNVTNDADLVKEVQDYLQMMMVGFHSKSRILITSSSKAFMEEFFPNVKFHMPMPTLTVEEARALFLKCAAPERALHQLTQEEQDILNICIEKCWSYSEVGVFYHPVQLIALGDYIFKLYKLGKPKRNELLVWMDHLDKEMGLVKDEAFKSSKVLFNTLALQYSTFQCTEKLLFLDLALYADISLPNVVNFDKVIGWLCQLHDESTRSIKLKLQDLRISGMIELELEDYIFDEWEMQCSVPRLYKDFAKWYAMNHKVNGLTNAYGVFQAEGMHSWSQLIRLCICNMTPANARLFGSTRMQEFSNLMVLQLFNCDALTKLNLEGLHCLRDLELYALYNLETITLSRNSSKDEYAGIFDSLRRVRLLNLKSLVDMPDLRRCTSLDLIDVLYCGEWESLDGANCRSLKDLSLGFYCLNDYSKTLVQLESLLHFDCLQSLERLRISGLIDLKSKYTGFHIEWKLKKDESDVGLEVALEGEGPSAMFFKKLCSLLCTLICTTFKLF